MERRKKSSGMKGLIPPLALYMSIKTRISRLIDSRWRQIRLAIKAGLLNIFYISQAKILIGLLGMMYSLKVLTLKSCSVFSSLHCNVYVRDKTLLIKNKLLSLETPSTYI